MHRLGSSEAGADWKVRGAFAVPFLFTRHVARGAAAAGVHYFDLTEDVETTHDVTVSSRTARPVMMPQCGLAPGFISIAGVIWPGVRRARGGARCAVGALTQFPTNGLKYNLTWSTAGLIHEYLQDCEAIVDGNNVHCQAARRS